MSEDLFKKLNINDDRDLELKVLLNKLKRDEVYYNSIMKISDYFKPLTHFEMLEIDRRQRHISDSESKSWIQYDLIPKPIPHDDIEDNITNTQKQDSSDDLFFWDSIEIQLRKFCLPELVGKDFTVKDLCIMSSIYDMISCETKPLEQNPFGSGYFEDTFVFFDLSIHRKTQIKEHILFPNSEKCQTTLLTLWNSKSTYSCIPSIELYDSEDKPMNMIYWNTYSGDNKEVRHYHSKFSVNQFIEFFYSYNKINNKSWIIFCQSASTPLEFLDELRFYFIIPNTKDSNFILVVIDSDFKIHYSECTINYIIYAATRYRLICVTSMFDLTFKNTKYGLESKNRLRRFISNLFDYSYKNN